MLKIKKNIQSGNPASSTGELQPRLIGGRATTYPPATTAIWHVGRGNLKPSKGFTLIELLVVIAIIGILSSVVLASLNSARSKGADAAIKSNLANIRAQAQMYYDENSNNYGTAYTVGICTGATGVFADTNMVNQIAAAKTAAGGTTSFNACASIDGGDGDGNGDNWAVAQQLKTDITKFWCVDSTGASKESTQTADQAGANATVLNGACQ